MATYCSTVRSVRKTLLDEISQRKEGFLVASMILCCKGGCCFEKVFLPLLYTFNSLLHDDELVKPSL